MLYLTVRFMEIAQIPSSDDTKTNVQEPKSSPIDRIGQVYTDAANSVQTALINAKNFILQ
jgi:hypothetical protein